MLTYRLCKVAGSPLIALVLAYLASNADSSAHPPFPDVTVVMTNATGAPANHLKVEGFGVTLNPVQSNAPGCPSPTIHLNSLIPISTWVIAWPEECVDPGESITFHTDIDCTDCGSPYVSSYQFSSTFATLTNTGLTPKSAVHVVLSTPAGSVPPVVSPPGCAPPTVTPGSPAPFTTLDIIWPSACVDGGESVKVDLNQLPYLSNGGTYGTSCVSCTNPTVSSYSWTPAPVGGFVELPASSTPNGSAGWLAVLLIALAVVLYRLLLARLPGRRH